VLFGPALQARRMGGLDRYQKQHNLSREAKDRPELKEDGKSGPKTREELVRDYMALDGVSLSDQEGFLIDIEVLGCGENFPLDQTGILLDSRIASARDSERDPVDRRVELFFFDDEFGVVPKPTGPKGEEYGECQDSCRLNRHAA